MLRRLAAVTGIILAAALPVCAQGLDLPGAEPIPGLGSQASHLRASAITSHGTIAPGGRFHVAVEIRIDDGWVFYSPMPGEIASVAEIAVQADGLVVGEILWPPDRRYVTDLGGGEKIVNHVYKKRAVIYIPLTVPPGARGGERSIAVTVSGQVCGRVCVLAEASASAVVTVGAQSVANEAWSAELADGLKQAMPAAQLPAARRAREPAEPAPPVPPSGVADLTVWAGLGLAFLAGLVLNIMPCVLPVVPLRILSLVQMAGQQRRRLITLGLAFAGGIVLFFVGLAVLNVFLRMAQQAFSISALFQFRPVRISLAMVLVALSANLFGAFNVVVPGRAAGPEGGAGRRGQEHLASVGMGLMMAVLATPCSFAILANALAWAQVVPLWLGTAAIVVIGLGMACPHAVLVAFPQLLDKLPRPGRWMELFKQSMGFLLLPVAIWLIFAGSDDAYPGWVVAYGVVLTACLWVWGTWVRYDAPLRRKIALRGSAVVLAVLAGYFMLTPAGPLAVKFEKFSPEAIAAAHKQGRVVLVKFTSATCLSCIYLDRTVYNDPAVAAEITDRDIAALKADTTDADTPASKMLRERFRGAPPLTVLLPPKGGTPVRLDGKFTKKDLIEAFDKAARR